jgi:hypothetical protein
MTNEQQTKIAEILVHKLKQAHNQAFEEILPPTVLQNQIRQQMVMAGVVYEMLKDAWANGARTGKWSMVFDKKIGRSDFDNFLNNIK